MAFNGEPSIGMCSQEYLFVILIFEPITFKIHQRHVDLLSYDKFFKKYVYALRRQVTTCLGRC